MFKSDTRRGSGIALPSIKRSSTTPRSAGSPSRAISVWTLSSWSFGTLPLVTRASQRLDDRRRIDGSQCEDQAPWLAAEIKAPRLDLRQPERGELAGRQPETVFEENVDRTIEGLQREIRRRQAASS